MKVTIACILSVSAGATAFGTSHLRPSALKGSSARKAASDPHLEACKNYTAPYLNNNPSVCANPQLDVACLERMVGGGSGLNRHCLNVLPDQVLDYLTPKLCKAFSAEDPRNIPLNAKFWKAFIRANDWKTNPVPQILLYVMEERPDFLANLIQGKGLPVPFLSHFFTAETVEKMPLYICEKLPRELASTLKSDAFKKINAACFGKISPDFFAMIGPSFFKQINPEAFAGLTLPQAEKVGVTTFMALTASQAKHFGPDFVDFAPDASPTEREVEQLKEVALQHPCQRVRVLQRVSHHPSKVLKIMKKRCAPVWTNWAAPGLSPLGMGSLLLLVLGSIVLLA